MRINATYFSREALSSFRKNIVQSIAAVTTVSLCLVVIGLILLVLFVGGQVIKKIENKVEIEVFLDGMETPEIVGAAGSNNTAAGRYQDVEQLGRELLSWPEVKEAKFISKEAAWEELKKNFKSMPEILEEIEGNPLPASYRISLKDPRKVEQVADRIKALPYIKSLVVDAEKNVKYGRDTVRKLFAVTRYISIGAAGFAALLIFVSLVLITNTIRLAIFARRKEIGIMRLVGASSWFIRWPFILEGMFEGLIGSILAIAVLTSLWRTFFANLAAGKVLAFLAFPFDQGAFFRLVLLLAVSGAAIGAMGSFIALRRYLKV